MADNTNKVTIDAALFAELYGCWQSMHDNTYCDRGICGKIIAERNKTEQAIKERDEALEQIKRFKDMELSLATKENYEREISKLEKERDELKKLTTSQNYEAVIAAKDREIAAVKEERNRLNAKVGELKEELKRYKIGYTLDACQGEECAQYKRLAAAERCIEDVFSAIENYDFSDEVNNALSIIRAYRDKEAK